MLLGGDLGGTKTLLALAELNNSRLEIIHQRRFASADYPSFDALLSEFLEAFPTAGKAIDTACFGLAGPTDGQYAQLTYLPWQLEAKAISRRFGIDQVRLANDFACAANGLSVIVPADLQTLHSGQPVAQAPRVILGAGTGLGVAGLIWQNGRYDVIPGEGGHVGFSPQSPEQGELWRWLLAQYGRVTSEDIISGPGLARIYAFLSGRPQYSKNGPETLRPEIIGQAALSGIDPLAGQALKLWLSCYGAFAGDLALQWLAHGGVYLAGGMVAKLLPHIDRTPFVEAFLNKREHAGLVKNMPVYGLTAEDLGLRGALALAAA
ncbi:MAG: glucokinase [Betaproteobacteria bacterium HGW-Betaproteobacteria-10]|nr:MAG: glucokinase [Betaproteobacteria bacterium HGW-Betaproteobacteria-10]